MLRVLVVLPLTLIACSKDRPAPVAPAGKSLASLNAPPAPTNLRFDAPTDSSCKVRWDASDGATDYDVNYKLDVGGKWTNEPHTGDRLYNTIYDLRSNTEYRWAVRAENSAGASAWVYGENFTTAQDTTFSITLYWEVTYPPHCVEAVEAAVAKWETIITGDLQDGPIGNEGRLLEALSIPDDAIIDDVAVVVRLNEDLVPKAYAKFGTWRSDRDYTKDLGVPIYGAIYLPDIVNNYRDYGVFGYELDEDGYRTDPAGREYQIGWERGMVNQVALHEIGHVLGLAPADEYHDRYGKYYGAMTLETWAQHAPAQLIRDYVPISGAHWGSGYIDSDKFILTNSTMSQLGILHNDLFDVPLHLHPDKFAADKIITDLDGAALADIGYTVDMDATEPLVVREGTTLFGKANTHAWVECGEIR